jgi:hypothetical protein
MNRRLVLLIVTLLGFMVFHQSRAFFGQVLPFIVEAPESPTVDPVTHVEQQVAEFISDVPKDEPVNYRITLKNGEVLIEAEYKEALGRVKYALCPAVIDQRNSARDLKKRIVNSSGQLSYKVIP